MEYKHGGDVYSNQGVMDLSSNVNPYKIPDSITKAIRNSISQLSNYPDSRCRELREKLGSRYEVPSDHVICGNGAADLIYSLVYAKKPKKALLLAPCFSEYEAALKNLDTEIVRYDLKEDLGFQLDAGILNCLTSEIDLFFLCTPNNPTGRIVEKYLQNAILEKCRKNQILLILDECFLDFSDKWKEASAVGYIEENPYLFILKSFTKMYGLAGLRLGYGISSNRTLLEQIESAGQPWPVSIPAQHAGIAALEEEKFAEETREKTAVEREWLLQKMNPYVKKVYASDVNFILFQAEEHLKESLLKKKILIRDCSDYYGLSSGYYRVAVKDRKTNQKFLEALKKRKMEK